MAWSTTPIRFEAIGTQWQIDFPDGLLASKQAEIVETIKERIAVFDKDYSRFRSDSLVTKISQVAGVYGLPADAEPLFMIYEQLYRLTNGLMTPLIGDVLVAAGYDPEYSLQPKVLTKPLPWEESMERHGLELTVKQSALLDVGAAGKGYLIDIVCEIIRAAGVTQYCVDAGGDMAYYSETDESLRVGLEHPNMPETIIGVAQIRNQSLCGSAGNRRSWSRFHHIINPETLTSPRHILGLWVVAPTTLIADALTTALFFTDPEVLAPHYQFKYLIMRADHSITRSKDFPVELFTS